MRSTPAQNRAYRESGVGRKHQLGDHYADGFKNGRKRVTDDPGLQHWFEVQSRAQAKGRYADWPPYRAYQLGFARGTRA